MVVGKIIALHDKRMRVADVHWYIREFNDNVFTIEVATTFGRTQQRIALSDILEKMDDVHPLGGSSDKTVSIDLLRRDVGKGTTALKVAVKYFSGPTATDAEKDAAAHVKKIVNSIIYSMRGEQKATMDSVRDKLALLASAAYLPHMAAIHQDGLLQTIIGKVDQFYLLYFQRSSENITKEQEDSMGELAEQAIVIIRDLFTLFEAEYVVATGDTKALALTAINGSNALNKDMNQTVDNRDHSKKSDDESDSDNSGGHKPHDPNKPSEDPNRPEGPEPNEDGDNTDDEDDSSDEEDDTSDTEDNTGGDTGNTDNGGSNKPPNPESPDRKDESDSKEMDIDIKIKEKDTTPEDTSKKKKKDTKKDDKKDDSSGTSGKKKRKKK
jgi:hypothetical protein